MSGIAGLFDLNHYLKNQIPIFKNMIASMKHRGNDDEGILLYDHVCLMHTRLAINDLNFEKQQLQSYPYALIYNGELSNAHELREILKQKGIFFETNCDSEVVLKAYTFYKESCLQHLKGFFAFAIYDESNEQLFLARDPFGIKPLFYTQINQGFYFASEIKTLFAHPLVQPIIDKEGIHQLAYLGPGHISGTTYFKNIFEVKPSTYMMIQKEQCQTFSYSSLTSHPHTDSQEETIHKVKELVHQAIYRQMNCDVPFGTFLSGGLDSSIVTAICANQLKTQGKKLPTFSIAYEDQETYFQPNAFQPSRDDSFIEQMVQTFGTQHTKITISNQNLIDALYEVVDVRDVPGMVDIDSALYCACKEVNQHVKVILSGECADEIFGGYPWFYSPLTNEFPWSKQIEMRQSFLQEQYQINPHHYIQNLIFDTIEEAPLEENDCCEDQQIKQLTYLNIRWFMQTLLDRKDRMTMANHLEARVPFCDIDLLSYVYSIPWQLKNIQHKEKGLLRVAMKELLPKEILYRKKSPFPKTHHPFYLKILREELSKLMDDETAPLWKIFNKERMHILIKEENSVPFYGQLMTTPQTIAYYLQINYWLKKYKIKIEK